MKDEQTRKLANLYDAIEAVINDPEIAIKSVLITSASANGELTARLMAKNDKQKQNSACLTEEEKQMKADIHAKLVAGIEKYRNDAFKKDNQLLMSITHLASAVNKPKAVIMDHIKDLLKDGLIEYVVVKMPISLGENCQPIIRRVRFLDLKKIVEAEQSVEESKRLFSESDICARVAAAFTSKSDMVVPIQ